MNDHPKKSPVDCYASVPMSKRGQQALKASVEAEAYTRRLRDRPESFLDLDGAEIVPDPALARGWTISIPVKGDTRHFYFMKFTTRKAAEVQLPHILDAFRDPSEVTRSLLRRFLIGQP